MREKSGIFLIQVISLVA